MKEHQLELTMRIIVRHPPQGVLFAMQRGKSGAADMMSLVAPKIVGDALVFEFHVRVDTSKAAGVPNYLGEFTQGPPASRFVYVNSGRSAGQPDTDWNRRAKIPLTDISRDLIESVRKDAARVLEIEIEGTGRDGGPVCATVKNSSGWRAAG